MPQDNNHPNSNLSTQDEPSPFVEDRADAGFGNYRKSWLSQPWIWFVALALAGIIIFSLAQKPAATPTKSNSVEPEAVAE